MPSEIPDAPAQTELPATAPEAALPAGDVKIENPDSAIANLSLAELSALQDKLAVTGAIGKAGDTLNTRITLEAEPEPEPAQTVPEPEPATEPEPPEPETEQASKNIRIKDPLDQAFISLRKTGMDANEAHRRIYGEPKAAEPALEPTAPVTTLDEMRAELTEIDAQLDASGTKEGLVGTELTNAIKRGRRLETAIAFAERDAQAEQQNAFKAESDARQTARKAVVEAGYADAEDASTPLGAEVARLVTEMQAEGKNADNSWVNPVLNSAKAPKLVVLEAAANIKFLPKTAAPAIPIATKIATTPKPLTAPGSARTTAQITITPAQALEQLNSLSPAQRDLVMAKAGEIAAKNARLAGYR